MADFQNFKLTHLANASRSVPRMQIELQVCDSQTGEVEQDFTGANAIMFPDVMGTFTAQQRRDVYEAAVRKIIAIRAGLE